MERNTTEQTDKATTHTYVMPVVREVPITKNGARIV